MPVRSAVAPSSLNLRAALAQLAAALEGPVSRAELIARVLTLHPSRAHHPEDLILAEARQSAEWVRLPDGGFAPLHWTLRGTRFRWTLSESEAASGVLALFPCFLPWAMAAPNAAPRLTVRDETCGAQIAQEEAQDGTLGLRAWLAAQKAVPGDHLLWTALDPRARLFSVGLERQAETDRAAVAIQDATLEAAMVALVERSASEQPFWEEIVPAALARLHDAACAYPGTHWHALIARSARLRLVDDYAIARATFRRPIDRLLGYAAPPAAIRALEARIGAFNADLRRALAGTGALALMRPAPGSRVGHEKALARSRHQVANFLGRDDDMSDDCARCLALPSVYLAVHEGVSLAEADWMMLCRFLLSFYPRHVLFNHKRFTARMVAALRRFYTAQAEAGDARAADLPRKLSRLHALVDRKVALSAEVDPDETEGERLTLALFPEGDTFEAARQWQ